MKILLTGGCGFIGSNLVRLLIDQTDHTVVNCDKLTYAGVAHSLSDLDGHSRYQHMLVDIADHQAVGKMIDEVEPDAIMHLAAESHVDRSIGGPSDFVQTNIVGTFNLLDHSRRYIGSLPAERRRAFRFLHVSTDEVLALLVRRESSMSRLAMHPIHPTLRPKRVRITWFVRGMTPTVYRSSSPIAQTTSVPTSCLRK